MRRFNRDRYTDGKVYHVRKKEVHAFRAYWKYCKWAMGRLEALNENGEQNEDLNNLENTLRWIEVIGKEVVAGVVLGRHYEAYLNLKKRMLKNAWKLRLVQGVDVTTILG